MWADGVGRTLKEICTQHVGTVPGSTAAEAAAAGRAAATSWAETTFGPEGALTTEGGDRLATLGSIIGFDMLMHNSDRFYLEGVFENFSGCGNLGNSCGKQTNLTMYRVLFKYI